MAHEHKKNTQKCCAKGISLIHSSLNLNLDTGYARKSKYGCRLGLSSGAQPKKCDGNNMMPQAKEAIVTVLHFMPIRSSA